MNKFTFMSEKFLRRTIINGTKNPFLTSEYLKRNIGLLNEDFYITKREHSLRGHLTSAWSIQICMLIVPGDLDDSHLKRLC